MISKHIIKSLFIALITICRTDAFNINKNNFANIGLGISAIAGTTILGKLAYNKIYNVIDEKIENEIVDNIVLAFTSNNIVNKMGNLEREDAFRKKARLINMRLRVMKKIEILANDPNSNLSKQHNINLKTWINRAKRIFKYIDRVKDSWFFKKNPYEQEYKKETLITSIIESKIIDSIVFSCKPENEYNSSDIERKAQGTERRNRILLKLKNRVSAISLDMLKKAIL